MFLQPNKVYLNVVPEQPREREKMYTELANIQRQYLKEEIEPSSGVKKLKLNRILSIKSRADRWPRLIIIFCIEDNKESRKFKRIIDILFAFSCGIYNV